MWSRGRCQDAYTNTEVMCWGVVRHKLCVEIVRHKARPYDVGNPSSTEKYLKTHFDKKGYK